MTVKGPLEERPRDFPAGAFDEGFRADGAPRRGYAELFASFGASALTEVAARVRDGSMSEASSSAAPIPLHSPSTQCRGSSTRASGTASSTA